MCTKDKRRKKENTKLTNVTISLSFSQLNYVNSPLFCRFAVWEQYLVSPFSHELCIAHECLFFELSAYWQDAQSRHGHGSLIYKEVVLLYLLSQKKNHTIL